MTSEQKTVLEQLTQVYKKISYSVNPARQLCIHIYEYSMNFPNHFAYYTPAGELIKSE